MINEVLDKYLENKKRVLLSYAESISKVYEIDRGLFVFDKDLDNVLSKIFDIYISKYYLVDRKSLNDLNVNKLGDRDFKMTLALSVVADYFGDKYDSVKDKYKDALYNLTLIVYVSVNVDKEISFYNSRGVVIKSIIRKLDELYSEVLGHKVTGNNPFLLDILASKIKDAERKEIRFFESIKSDESYNRFVRLDKDMMFVDYVCNLKSLYKFNEDDVKYVYKEYNFLESNFSVCYELMVISILKFISNNAFVPKFVLPINMKYIADKESFNRFLDIFKNEYIKKHIVFGVTKEEMEVSEAKYSSFKTYGFDVIVVEDFKNDFLSEDELIEMYIVKEI